MRNSLRAVLFLLSAALALQFPFVSNSSAGQSLPVFNIRGKTGGLTCSVSVSGNCINGGDKSSACKNSLQLVVKAGFGFSVGGMPRLSIIDLRDPDNPVEVACLDATEAVSSIRLNGNYVYLFSDRHIFTVDISNPLSPVLLTETPCFTGGLPESICTNEDFLYIVCGSLLMTFSVKEPSKPAFMGFNNLGPEAETPKACNIAVRDEIAYITGIDRGICLYDVADISDIKYLGSYSSNSVKYSGLYFTGNLAFAYIEDKKSFEVIDITSAKEPKHAGSIEGISFAGSGFDLASLGNYLLVPDSKGLVLAADITRPQAIKLTGGITMSEIPVSISVQGNKAYVADESGAVSVMDVAADASQPAASPSPSAIPSPNPPLGGKIAYLTFDDGPSRSMTPANLDTLKAYGIKATFFVLPYNNLDDIYKRIIDEGHAIGNHSYSHDTGFVRNAVKFRRDVIKARDFIYSKFNYTTKVFRFPGGSGGHAKARVITCANILRELGYSYFDWDVSTADTDPNLKTYGNDEFLVDLLADNVIEKTGGKKKLIVLMHDSSDKSYTSKALPKIIDGLIKQGYGFDVLTNY